MRKGKSHLRNISILKTKHVAHEYIPFFCFVLYFNDLLIYSLFSHTGFFYFSPFFVSGKSGKLIRRQGFPLARVTLPQRLHTQYPTLLLLIFIRLQVFHFLSPLKIYHSHLHHEEWRQRVNRRGVSCVIRRDAHHHSVSHETAMGTAPGLHRRTGLGPLGVHGPFPSRLRKVFATIVSNFIFTIVCLGRIFPASRTSPSQQNGRMGQDARSTEL